MGILTKLNEGQKFRFEESDSDIWGYNGKVLQQYLDNESTGNTLTIVSVNEDTITIDWGDIESTLPESYLYWVVS